jgi:hypothetical protein
VNVTLLPALIVAVFAVMLDTTSGAVMTKGTEAAASPAVCPAFLAQTPIR